MPNPEIEAICSLIKKDNAVIGVSLVAKPQCEAEIFCSYFPASFVEKKSFIKFLGTKKMGHQVITFSLPNRGDVGFLIEVADATALQKVLQNQEISLYPDGYMTPGFKIVPDGMDKVGEKVELCKIH